jgi:hypothetical protein
METVYGNKYESSKNLNTAQIAKCFRSDVKVAILDGRLPEGLKLSVKIARFAGGSSIDVKVVNLPAGFKFCEETRQGHITPLTPDGKLVMDLLKEMLDAYNYDGSDLMTDYFNVRFYSHIGVCSSLWDHLTQPAGVGAAGPGH